MNRAWQVDGDQIVSLEMETEGDSLRIRLPDSSTHTVTVRRMTGNVIEIREGDRVVRVPFVSGKNGAVSLSWGGAAYTFVPTQTAAVQSIAAKQASGLLTSPMAGIVAEVKRTRGDHVAAFEAIATIEAMKVLATVEAPFAGTVRAIHVQKGDRVDHEAAIAEIEPE